MSPRSEEPAPQVAAELVRQADAAYLREDFDSAESSYRKAIAATATFAPAYLGLGATLYALGRLDEAIAALGKAAQIDGQLVDAHELLAAAYLALSDNPQAERHLRRALALHPVEANFLNLGAVLVNQRRHDEAFKLVTEGITANPQSAELQFFLGNLHFESGQFETAATLYRDALKLKPDQALGLYNLGLVSLRLNDFQTARDVFRRAVELNPDWGDAHINLGNVFSNLGNLTEANACFERALACNPSLALAQLNLGKIAAMQGDDAKAAAHYEKALEINPDMAEAHVSLAISLSGLDRWAEAINHLLHVRQIEPGNTEALIQLAHSYFAQRDFQAALSRYREIVALAPDNVDALFCVASTLRKLAESDVVALRTPMLQDAAATLRKVIDLSEYHRQALLDLGSVLGELEQFEEADSMFRKVLAFDPACVDAHHNLGVSMETLGRNGQVSQRLARYGEALEHYAAAIALNPDNVHTLMGLASIHGELLHSEEAARSYEQVVRLASDHAPGRMSYGMLKLRSGDLASGWRDYEYRWQLAGESARIKSDKPQWRNDADLSGKTVILYHEQGLGDSLQFVRYAKLLAERGATVLVKVPGPLQLLFASCPGVYRIISDSEGIPAHDYHSSFVSLAGAFATTLDTIPAEIPYLQASPDRVAHWKQKLGAEDTLRVGLVWAGDARKHLQGMSVVDAMRSMHFDQLRPLLDVPKVAFYSLQVGSETAAQLTNAPQVIDFSGELFDFQETAALTENLDLVISVDTSSAHLVGAIGKPIWLLNRFNTCWRWMLERSDSPWYPTMRIFRQPQMGDWDSVIAEVRIALQAEAVRKSQHT